MRFPIGAIIPDQSFNDRPRRLSLPAPVRWSPEARRRIVPVGRCRPAQQRSGAARPLGASGAVQTPRIVAALPTARPQQTAGLGSISWPFPTPHFGSISWTVPAAHFGSISWPFSTAHFGSVSWTVPTAEPRPTAPGACTVAGSLKGPEFWTTAGVIEAGGALRAARPIAAQRGIAFEGSQPPETPASRRPCESYWAGGVGRVAGETPQPCAIGDNHRGLGLRSQRPAFRNGPAAPIRAVAISWVTVGSPGTYTGPARAGTCPAAWIIAAATPVATSWAITAPRLVAATGITAVPGGIARAWTLEAWKVTFGGNI
jgi:hypothetical protein